MKCRKKMTRNQSISGVGSFTRALMSTQIQKIVAAIPRIQNNAIRAIAPRGSHQAG
jgi:hypothetical protein